MSFKKVLTMIIAAIIVAFVVCFIIGSIITPHVYLLSTTVASYKVCGALMLYLKMLPGVVATALLVALSLEFGRDKTGYTKRFSREQLSRLRFALIIIMALIAILSVVEEAAVPSVERKMAQYRAMPSRVSEYKDFAQSLLDIGRVSLAFEMANAALKLSPDDLEAQLVADEAEGRLNNNIASADTDKGASASHKTSLRLRKLGKQNACGRYAVPLRHSNTATNNVATSNSAITSNSTATSGSATTIPLNGSVIADEYGRSAASENYTQRDLLVLARRSWREGDFFSAHYYSSLYIKASVDGDPWKSEMDKMAHDAWDAIEEIRSHYSSAESALFARKMAGYNALMAGDNVKAYYIFKSLSRESDKMALDRDVVRYLALSETALLRDYFFSDETINIEHFESASDVYFKITSEDGSSTLYFIRGITPVITKQSAVLKTASGGESSAVVEYLRGLCVVTLDPKGNYQTGKYFPYAKMTALDVSTLPLEYQETLGVALFHTVPHIVLNSVDRSERGIVTSAIYFHGKSNSVDSDTHLVLPMPLEEFELIRKASLGVNSMSISDLKDFCPVAGRYGYSSQVYSQTLLNRVLYPPFLLSCFMLITLMAFQYRLDSVHGVFKFKWVTVFPVLCVIFVMLYYVARSLFKLVNYNLFSHAAVGSGVVAICARGFVLQVLVFALLCVVFLSCHED